MTCKERFEKVYTDRFNNLKDRHYYSLESRLNYDYKKFRYTNPETQQAWIWFQLGVNSNV